VQNISHEREVWVYFVHHGKERLRAAKVQPQGCQCMPSLFHARIQTIHVLFVVNA
jgi:hypothetical protein